VQPLATSKALFIHRNTLEYRLNRISELTGLDLGILTIGCCCILRCSWMNSVRR
jgi:sugar diacid utilization regulator